MAWRRLNESPSFGASPPPWRPWCRDARRPGRKIALYKVRIQTWFNGGLTADETSGWLPEPDIFNASGGALNQTGNVTTMRFTLTAANIGRPWRLDWRDRIIDLLGGPDTYTENSLIILPGDVHTVDYNTALDTSKSLYEAMVCVTC